MSTATVLEMKKAVVEWLYQTADVVVLPYSAKHLTIFPEDFLGRIYMRLKEEHTLHRIFPGMGVSHLNKFMAYMNTAQGLLIACLKTNARPHPVGFGWVTETDGVDGARRGAFGFGFFKEVWGQKSNVDLSHLMLAYWFWEMKINILYASTLQSNRLAVSYSKQFGFQYIGRLPKFYVADGKMLDAELIVLERDNYQPIHAAWRDSLEG